MVGRHREGFRFDKLFGILTGLPRTRLIEEVERGFSHLPPGCNVQLDRVAREQVLKSLREVANYNWGSIAKELVTYLSLPEHSNKKLADFIYDNGIELEEIYPVNKADARGWTALKRKANLLRETPSEYEESISRKITNIMKMQDRFFLETIQQISKSDTIPNFSSFTKDQKTHIHFLATELFPNREDACNGEELLERLRNEALIRDELFQLSSFLLESYFADESNDILIYDEWPLRLHSHYTMRAILLATGKNDPKSRYIHQPGVLRFEEQKIELQFITLDKSKGFHQSISYHDYAIRPDRFHWQSQNTAGQNTPAGRRYLPGKDDGWRFFLFVRSTKADSYCAIGEGFSIEAEGNKPISVTYRLKHPLSPELFDRFNVL